MALCSISHHFSVAGFITNHSISSSSNNSNSVCAKSSRHRVCAKHSTTAGSFPTTASIDSGMSKNLYVRLASPDIYNIPPHQLSSKPSTARDSDLSSSGSGDPPARSPSPAHWGRNPHTLSRSGQAQAFAAACNVFKASLRDDQNQGSPPDIDGSRNPTIEHTTLTGRDENLISADSRGVPVYVMLPLDSIDASTNSVNRRKAMDVSLCALRSAGVEGVMVDVWWGIVERDEPGRYDWSGYLDLIRMVKKHGLKVQAVMSFHQCGGNVGDSFSISLPKWVIEEFSSNPDLAFTDKQGRRNFEYVSFGCDLLPVLKGRSPVQVYADYMRSFRETFTDFIGDTIVEIQVGMGPAGELKYPSYPETNGIWKFPGIGEFQCYDKYMMSSLKAAANKIGKPEWGCGPSQTGCYSSYPEGTEFFGADGGWSTPYGSFFLEWYSSLLLVHGERIFTVAEAIFRSCRVRLSGRVASIYWHYASKSHAAELTAGYFNTQYRDGYVPIASMFGRHGAVLNVSSVEMKDTEQPFEGQCSPESLIKQIVLAARKTSVAMSGNNALPRFDEEAFKQVIATSRLRSKDDPCGVAYEPMCAFTFLRMAKSLFQSNNWRQFVAFVRQMRVGRPSNQWVREQKPPSEHLQAASRPPFIEETATAATTLA